MQSSAWYLHRLRGMGPSEIMWRLRGATNDWVDRRRVAAGQLPALSAALIPGRIESGAPPFRVSDLRVGGWGTPGAEEDAARFATLTTEAETLCRHRLTFLGLEDRFLGDPIEWNRDHAMGVSSPLAFSGSIDYRDVRVAGDCKLVWEPSRHHQLVVLARAYRATGDRRYAVEVVAQLESWLDQCPYGRGMNWRSPMELAIRLINWVWALDLIRESNLVTGALRDRVLHAVYLHLWDVTRKYSRGSSANNHRIGEAAGVFVAASYFPCFRESDRWRTESQAILVREIELQTFPDGCNREQALGYQLFVLQFFLLAGLVGRWTGRDFPETYWSRVEGMLDFLATLAEGGDGLPLFGDSDDGYVLDLGNRPDDLGTLFAWGAVLFDRPDLARLAGPCPESVTWLLGQAGEERFSHLAAGANAIPLASRDFPNSGYYLLQHGHTPGPDRISVLFDCGELGFGSIAGHGHADALAFTLRAFGEDVLVDPGTYDYFTYPEWRRYFRSTRAHNTAVVDGLDQSTMLGPFLWGQRARARCLRWEPRDNGGLVAGEHDGYTRLPDPVVHRRTLELDGPGRALIVTDEFQAATAHEIRLHFHTAEGAGVSRPEPARLRLELARGTVVLELDPRLTVTLHTGEDDPIAGWVSRGYHRKSPAATVAAAASIQGSDRFVCRLRWERSP